MYNLGTRTTAFGLVFINGARSAGICPIKCWRSFDIRVTYRLMSVVRQAVVSYCLPPDFHRHVVIYVCSLHQCGIHSIVFSIYTQRVLDSSRTTSD